MHEGATAVIHCRIGRSGNRLLKLEGAGLILHERADWLKQCDAFGGLLYSVPHIRVAVCMMLTVLQIMMYAP